MAPKLRLAAHTCNPSTGEAKAGGFSLVQGQLGLQNELCLATSNLIHSFPFKDGLKMQQASRGGSAKRRHGCVYKPQKIAA